ncbi:MAG: Gfo/Idh/MocA family oxidoreductase [Dehalococcoidia bacterium]|nr:Gfo/Idh/MocA family oxidoreductase [Dehalococcoidia bacterium]
MAGCGAVFARLYAPALAGLPALRLVAAADPDPARLAHLPAGCQAFASLEAMLTVARLDAVALLAPPAAHAAQVAEALACGLPVLVEKPAALRRTEVDRWPPTAAGLLTPAFPRRWWPAYRRLGAEAVGARRITIGIRTAPAAWGATTGEDPLVDLLPHAADLARWLSGREAAFERVERSAGMVRVTLALAGGGGAVCLLSHAGPYREAVRVDGRTHHVGPPGPCASLLRRLRGGAAPDVAAVRMMLASWADRLQAQAAPDLPGLADARANVALLEAARAALE